jgi:hypothetical protein
MTDLIFLFLVGRPKQVSLIIYFLCAHNNLSTGTEELSITLPAGWLSGDGW